MLSLILITLIGCGEKEDDTAEVTVIEESNQNDIHCWNRYLRFCLYMGLVYNPIESKKKYLTR